EVLSELDPQDSADILVQLPLEQISKLFHMIPSDDAAPILELLPEDLRESVLS
ncbi:MAG: magnesium transporter, partial [Candidatus Aenigmarchaeota archaeon]|nr:magnesium transporter [Candidatus Aenigmarchaeota archaeon]